MIRRCVQAAVPFVLLLPLTAHTGGWATITVEDLPDYVVARQPLDLAFTIRAHGMAPLEDLKPVVEASAGKVRTTFDAVPQSAPGRYAVRLSVPEPGDWTVTIHSRFGPSQVTLLPLRAVGAGALAPPAYTPAERGHRLFVAKGCVTCHVHGEVKGSGVAKVGPDLTTSRFTADYLARFLADPTIKPPTTQFRMPNLGLKPNETRALIAFLNAERETPKSVAKSK